MRHLHISAKDGDDGRGCAFSGNADVAGMYDGVLITEAASVRAAIEEEECEGIG